MKATHLDAINRYDEFRKTARNLAKEDLPDYLKKVTKLEGVDQKALVAFKTWQSVSERTVNWDWNFATVYCRRYPKAFDLSVWYGNTLCSLTLGRPTYKGTSMRMDFIEKSPINCPISGDIFAISLLAYENYGRLIGAEYLRLIEPMNDKLIKYYTSVDVGFSYRKAKQGNPHYLVKKL